MSIDKNRTIEDTVFFWFGSNNTSGSGDDGATPVFDVRLAGAAAGAAPVLSGSGTLLTHANFPPGAHEAAIDATVANGFAANLEYSVFSTLLVDSQNPTGFIGSFTLTPLATSDQVNNIGSGATGGTHVEATFDNTTRDVIVNGGTDDDKGGGLVGIPVTGHSFVVGREVTIANTVNYNGAFEVISQTVNEVVITATFVGETFGPDDTIVSSIKGEIFVGTVTGGTFADTVAANGNTHDIDDVGNEIKIVYGYNVGGSRQATDIAIFANVDGNNDEIIVKAFNFVTQQFEEKGTLEGSGGSSFIPLDPALVSRNTGTGVEIGDVFIFFDTVTTTPSVLQVDECLLTAAGTNVLIGYPNGFEVAAAGTSGTEFGVNGTAGNPCPFADAITMNSANPLNKFAIGNGETVTLAANSDNLTLRGATWVLALGGQSIAGALFDGPHVTGTGTSSGEEAHFINAKMGACTIPPSFLDKCGIGDDSGTLTAGSAGDYIFIECYSMAPGDAQPVLTFTGLGSVTGINNRGWKGGATWNVDSDITISHCVLVGGGTTFNTSGADIEVRGPMRSLDVVFSAGGTTPAVQFVGIVGPITLSGTATSTTVNLFGISTSLTDTSVNTTVTDGTTSRANITGGDYQLATDSNGVIDASLVQIDGLTTTDGAAILSLKQLSVFNSTGDAVTFSTSGAGDDALTLLASGASAIGLSVDSTLSIGARFTGVDSSSQISSNIDGTVSGNATPSNVTTAHSTTDGKVDAVKGDTAAILLDTGTDGVVLTTAERNATVDAVWDEVISSSAHNASQSAGKRLRQATSLVVANDTAEVSNSPAVNQIQLASGESTDDGTFDPSLVGIVAGTGIGQCRLILEYKGSTRIATLNRDWKVTPDGTSEYIIMCTDGGLHVNEGLAQGGGASSITLNVLASSANDVYIGQFVFLVSGPGQDQVGRVTAYNGTTKVATIMTTTNGWVSGQLPTSATGYIMMPFLDVVPTLIGTPAASVSADIAAVKVDTAAILVDTGTGGVVVAAASKTGYELSATGVTAVAAGVGAFVIETGLTLQQSMMLANAANAGKLNGAGTTTVNIRDAADTKNRIQMTVDSSGNRTTRVVDVT